MIAYSPGTMTPLALPKGCMGKVWEYRNRGNVGFLHYHEEIELNLVLSGTARCLVAGRSYGINAGTLMWLPSRKEHLLSEKSADLHMWIAVVRPGAVGIDQLSSGGDSDESLCKRVPLRTLTQIAALFKEVAASPEPMGMFNAGLVYAVLKAWEAHRRGQQGLADAALHSSVQKAIGLMQREVNDGNAMAIPEVARRVGLSSSRFVEVFKRDTGMTPVEFRNRQRIERFLHLYGEGQTRTMLSAAFDAGFGSYPQFFRVFEQVMGCGPAEWKRAGENSEFRVQNSE